MRWILLPAFLSWIVIVHAGSDEATISTNREDRQLFVTMIPHETSSVDTTNPTESFPTEFKRSSLFTRSFPSTPTRVPGSIQYIPLSNLEGITPDDSSTRSQRFQTTMDKQYTSISSSTKSEPFNGFSTSGNQFSSLGSTRSYRPSTRSPTLNLNLEHNNRQEDLLNRNNNKGSVNNSANSPMRKRGSTATIQRTNAPESATPSSTFNSHHTSKITRSSYSSTATESTAPMTTKQDVSSDVSQSNISSSGDDEQRSALIRMPSRDTQV